MAIPSSGTLGSGADGEGTSGASDHAVGITGKSRPVTTGGSTSGVSMGAPVSTTGSTGSTTRWTFGRSTGFTGNSTDRTSSCIGTSSTHASGAGAKLVVRESTGGVASAGPGAPAVPAANSGRRTEATTRR